MQSTHVTAQQDVGRRVACLNIPVIFCCCSYLYFACRALVVLVGTGLCGLHNVRLIRYRNETWVAFLCWGYDFCRRDEETDARTGPHDIGTGSKANMSGGLAVGEHAPEENTRNTPPEATARQ